jgi:hypothetical protein
MLLSVPCAAVTKTPRHSFAGSQLISHPFPEGLQYILFIIQIYHHDNPFPNDFKIHETIEDPMIQSLIISSLDKEHHKLHQPNNDTAFYNDQQAHETITKGNQETISKEITLQESTKTTGSPFAKASKVSRPFHKAEQRRHSSHLLLRGR